MALELSYSFNDFSNVYQLQALGQVISGAESINGIGAALTLEDGIMKATVTDSDAQTALGQRSEIRVPSSNRSEYWYSFEFMVPQDWDDAKAMSIMQIHDSPDVGDLSRFPNFLLTVEGSGIVVLCPIANLPVENANGVRLSYYPLVKGRWNFCVLHAFWQINTTGFREFFINNVPILRQFNLPTHYDDLNGPYLKLGTYDFYHSGGFGTKTAYYRNIKIWSGNDGYTSIMGSPPRPPIRMLQL